MTVEEAKQKFNVLRKAVLADGKVDIEEVDVLLSFVEGYIVNEKFLKFKEVLLRCKADGKITENESKMIVKEIDFLSKFLTIETFIEKVVIWSIGIGVAALIAWHLLLK